MAKFKFSLTHQDSVTLDLIAQTDHKTLAIWSKACAERVLHYFEDAFPDDPRPREALDTLQAWIDTGMFKMAVIRSASLGSHAAARDVGANTPARSAARAVGQAVATAHVRTHAIGGAMYALQAIYRAGGDEDALEAERTWQRERLRSLGNIRSLRRS